jgi:transcriptional regulator with XRE-family HTH domain
VSEQQAPKSFKQLFAEARQHPDFYKELAILEFTEELVRAMEQAGVSRSELARRIDRSPAYITKVLRGSANFTLASMTKLALALDMELKLNLVPAKGAARPTSSATGLAVTGHETASRTGG